MSMTYPFDNNKIYVLKYKDIMYNFTISKRTSLCIFERYFIELWNNHYFRIEDHHVQFRVEPNPQNIDANTMADSIGNILNTSYL